MPIFVTCWIKHTYSYKRYILPGILLYSLNFILPFYLIIAEKIGSENADLSDEAVPVTYELMSLQHEALTTKGLKMRV